MRYDTARLADFSVLQSGERKNGVDRIFLILILILLCFGVIMVLSASFPRASYDPAHVTGGNAAYYFVRQLIFAAVGAGAMLLASRFPMGFYRRYAVHFMVFTLILLALVPFIGVKANGSRRWLGVGSLTLQPSELAKLAVILLFAAMICRRRGRMRSFREGILPFALILALIVGLLVLEPHFSASIIILAIGAVMIFLGGAPLGWFAAAFGAVLAVNPLLALIALPVVRRASSSVRPVRRLACCSSSFLMLPHESVPGAIPSPALRMRAIRSSSPFTRSARAAWEAWDSAGADKNICTCRRSITILYSPSCARSSAFWAQRWCSCFSPC